MNNEFFKEASLIACLRCQTSGCPPPKRFLAVSHGVEPLFSTHAQTSMDTGLLPAPANTGYRYF
jgi:hypothetical protein